MSDYTKGLIDGYNIVARINDYTYEQLSDIFGACSLKFILKNFTPNEAVEKMNAYDKAQIEVGDVVKYGKTEYVVCSIVEGGITNKTNYCGVDGKGIWHGESDVTKTGKHIDLSQIFEQIGE